MYGSAYGRTPATVRGAERQEQPPALNWPQWRIVTKRTAAAAGPRTRPPRRDDSDPRRLCNLDVSPDRRLSRAATFDVVPVPADCRFKFAFVCFPMSAPLQRSHSSGGGISDSQYKSLEVCWQMLVYRQPRLCASRRISKKPEGIVASRSMCGSRWDPPHPRKQTPILCSEGRG